MSADPTPHDQPAEPGAWTTRRLLAWMSEAFGRAGLESPRLQSEMLLAHVLGCQRLRLFIEPERPATDAERARLRDLAARALRHEPIDYLVGERSFFGLLFHVDRRVLVPRPSTETIVEHALQEARRAAGAGPNKRSDEPPAGIRAEPATRQAPPAREVVFDASERAPAAVLSAFTPTAQELEDLEAQDGDEHPGPRSRAHPRAAPSPSPTPTEATPVSRRPRPAGPAWRIADVCTGSGCIAVAIARNLPQAVVTATDISRDALSVAAANTARHGVSDRVALAEGNLLYPLRGRGPFDAILANPPYIPDDEWDAVPPNVRDHEPTIALRGGADGLDLVRPIIAEAAGLLSPGGLLLVEVAASRAEAALDIARSTPGLEQVAILTDCDGLPRVLRARRASH